MANDQQPKQDAPAEPQDDGKRLDEFEGQPFYLDAKGRKVDPDGNPLQDKKA